MSKNKKIDGRSSEARQQALARGDQIQDMYLSPNRQCTAMSKIHGRQCLNRAMVGSRTCRMHGAATRKARTAANKRVAESSGFAADLLVELMADPETDKTLRTKIAQDLLDRAGVNTKTILELQPKPMTLFEQAILSASMSSEVVMDLDWDGEDVIDAEVVDTDDHDDDDELRYQTEDDGHERLREIERMKRGTPTPAAPDLNEQRARQEADAIRAHAAGELGDDDLRPEQAARRPQPDRFGVTRDTSAEDAALRRSAAASRRADKTVRSTRSTSTADPYADRYPERSGGRRSISPKRYEQRKREGGQG